MNIQSHSLDCADVAGDRADAAARLSRGVNWEGLRTLYRREVLRFWKVGMQTLLASPVVTTLLYMMIFVVAMRGARPAMCRACRSPSSSARA